MITIRATYTFPLRTRLEIALGNLTQAKVDAIVNAANEYLKHGGGIAAGIVQAGGWSIQEESNDWVRKHGLVTHAEPAYTRGGKLPARYIIHAVGPIWHEKSDDAETAAARRADADLASAIRGSLLRAEELGCHSIAFPAISIGIFGFPRQRAARIFFETFKTYFEEKQDTSINLVQMILWTEDILSTFLAESAKVLGPASAS
jgi:putative ATPase